jgi:hypothetical protein
MNAWSGLLKKDFRLTRTMFFTGMVINMLVFMLAMFVEMKFGDPISMFFPLIAAVVLHVFYIPIILFISLKTEGNQLHLWLHNPQSAVSLLSSKLLIVALKMTASLALLYVMLTVLIIPKFSLVEAYWTDTWIAGLLIFIHIIFISISMGVWVIFLWTLYHFMKGKIGRWSWLAVIAAIILPGWITAKIESTKFFMLITQWGGMELKFPTFSTEPIPLYAGEYLYQVIILVGLFYLSAWMIDNKVEV